MADLVEQLRCFLVVAEEGHVGRAADRLGLAQPALTQRMRRLQDELGVRLLEPSGRGIALTEAGRMIGAGAPGPLASLDDLLRRVRRSLLPGDRPWTLSVPATLAPPRLLTLQRRLEGLVAPRRCRITAGGPEQRRHQLDQGAADAAVVPVEASGDLSVPLGIAVMPGHPLAGLDVVHPQDLVEDGLVLLEEEEASRDRIVAAFGRHGLRADRIETGAPPSVVVVRVHGGVAALMDREHADDLGLRWAPLSDGSSGGPVRRDYAVLCPSDDPDLRDGVIEALLAVHPSARRTSTTWSANWRQVVCARVERLWRDVGVDGALHAMDLSTGTSLGIDTDRPWVLASVSKVALSVAAHRAHAEGVVDLARIVRLVPDGRAAGTTGVSAMDDEVRMSLRDAMQLALVISDNAAADGLWDAVGAAELSRQLAGLTGPAAQLSVGEPFRDLYDRVLLEGRDVEAPSASRGSARALTGLLELVWSDRAADPAACARIRDLMSRQLFQARLRGGFPDRSVRVAGKTGTFGPYRHEIGVIEHPGGRAVAVAVLTRSRPEARPAQVDRVIGETARLAVEALGESHD